MSDLILGRVVFGPATSDTSVDWPLHHKAGMTLVMVRQEDLDALHARIAELEAECSSLRSAVMAALHDLETSEGLIVSDNGEAWPLQHTSIPALRVVLTKDSD